MPPKKSNKITKKKPINGNTKKKPIKGKTIVRKTHVADLSTGFGLMNVESTYKDGLKNAESSYKVGLEDGKKATAERVNPIIVKSRPSQFYKKDLESNILIPMSYQSVYEQYGSELHPTLNKYSKKSNGAGKYTRALALGGFQQGLLNIDQRTKDIKTPILFKMDGGPIIYTQPFSDAMHTDPINMSRMMDAVISEPVSSALYNKYMNLNP